MSARDRTALEGIRHVCYRISDVKCMPRETFFSMVRFTTSADKMDEGGMIYSRLRLL